MRLLLILMLIVVFVSAAQAANVLDAEITCTYSDKEFSEIAADLGKQAGAEILVDPAIKGKVTINLEKTTLGKAMDRVCALTGVFYGQVSEKSIVIATANPKGPFFSLIMQIEMVPLNYIETKQLLNLMANSPYLPLIAADDALNQVTVTGPRPIIERIKAQIAQFDQPKFQISAHAQFLDTSSINQKDWGSIWELTNGKFNPDGLQTFQFDGTTLGFRNTREGNILYKLFSSISADKLKILSRPYLTVQAGEQGRVFIGRKSYFPITTVYGTQPVKVEPIEAGTSLTITPRVVEKNRITVKLRGEASEVTGSGISGYPNINSRIVETTLTVLDGETIIIGGLTGTLDYYIRSKVPVLGNLPLIGKLLFRSESKNYRQQEITILLTMHILKPGKNVPAVEKAEERAPSIGVPTPPVGELAPSPTPEPKSSTK